MASRILREGQNCSEIVKASRVKFLIDGADYFAALADALEQARESVFILGWDFDSRVHLKYAADGRPALPNLGRYLNALVKRHRSLKIYILVWDFAMIFALDREITPFFGPDWRRHGRVHFCMDGYHPVGASHHEKIVVIDDSLAFTGGLDLTKGRWDTRDHRPRDSRRVDASGAFMSPHHDIQVAAQGEVAAALGRRARERWQRATGQTLPSPGARDDLWPAGLSPDLTDVDVAISRTIPAFAEDSETREIETLYLDAIAAAQRWIFIENQYLSCAVVGRALEKRLRPEHGPEIVIVISQSSGGWLESATMDVLRARLFKRLSEADRHRRLRIYCPVSEDQDAGCITVHSKLLLIDDRLVHIGSANLSNRSMGFDTECGLSLESEGRADIRQACERLRNSLLAEHLGTESDRVAARLKETESLIATIEKLRGEQPRSLELMDCAVPEWLDPMVPESAVVDPEAPVAPEKLIEELVVSEQKGSGSGALLRGLVILAVLLAAAAAWRWSGLADGLPTQAVATVWHSLRNDPSAPFWVIGGFLVGGLANLPITLLIIGAAFLLQTWLAIFCAVSGSLLSALLLYAIGRKLGRRRLGRLAGGRLNRVNRLILQQGALALAAVRMLPIAPYSLLNLAAGTAKLPLRDFFLGTLLGLSPVIIGISFFAERLEHLVRNPTATNFVLLLGVLLALGVAIVGLRRWIASKQARGPDNGASLASPGGSR